MPDSDPHVIIRRANQADLPALGKLGTAVVFGARSGSTSTLKLRLTLR